MIRGVIFDVDGVLLNSMPVWENLGEIYLERLGIEAEKGLGETLFAMSLEEGADYLIENYGLKQTPGEIIAGLNREVQDFYGRKVRSKKACADIWRNSGTGRSRWRSPRRETGQMRRRR